ncbi:MAG TPA: N-acetylmuramoyl-L-alanine amidase, partial [Bacteroidia bacterium]
MQKYLDKDGKASEIFSFTKDGIEVYQPKTDSSMKKVDYIIYWDIYWNDTLTSPPINATDIIKNHFIIPDAPFDWNYLSHRCKIEYQARQSQGSMKAPRYPVLYQATTIKKGNGKMLDGYKICLDPGHIAGDLETAKKEKKWVEMKNSKQALIEGELTLETALILKKKLEAEGAEVMLTRSKPNQSSFGMDFKDWKENLFHKQLDSAYARGDVSFEEKNFLLHKANDDELFRRFFTTEDIHERARKINEFHPDITLIIHYNVDETNQNWNKPTKKDFNMAFVGGSFGDDELDKPEARIDFLRLLLTDDLEKSIAFSKFMMESLVKVTK